MVEVAGVEPASLELLRKASTCLFSFLISPVQPRRNRAAWISQPSEEVRLGRRRQPPRLCSLVVASSYLASIDRGDVADYAARGISSCVPFVFLIEV